MSDNASAIKGLLARLSRLDRDGRVIRPRPPFPVNTKLKKQLEQQKENND
jgi:hypothetical protein